MYKILSLSILLFIFSSSVAQTRLTTVIDLDTEAENIKENIQAELRSWHDAHFGMFISWGLYSQCEGYWNGKPIDGLGDWILKTGKIPVEEYKGLANNFTAPDFNAEEWVKLAKQAGMKYIIITAKHHDGFALFKSKADNFNVVDATPLKRDVIGEFVEACNKHEMKIGFYYSLSQDWSYQEAGTEKYMDEKVVPQIKELLTNYGKIDILWLDNSSRTTIGQDKALRDLSIKLQPDIILKTGVNPYEQKGDNNLPKFREKSYWQVRASMNNTWGYKRDDNDWKSAEYMIWQLVTTVAFNGNYLLGIAPKADGTVPQESTDRLIEIGEWLKINGEAIYGVNRSPFFHGFDWGAITQKDGKLYLTVFDWPDEKLAIYGLNNRILKAYFLTDTKKESLVVSKDEGYTFIHLPKEMPDKYATVIVLEIGIAAMVNNSLIQKIDGRIILEAGIAKNTSKSEIRFGSVHKWLKPVGVLRWNVSVRKPGKFRVEVITTGWKQDLYPEKPVLWDGGHTATLRCGKVSIKGIVDNDRTEKTTRDQYDDFKIANFGTIEIEEAENYTIELIPNDIVSTNKAGFSVRMVRLIPIK